MPVSSYRFVFRSADGSQVFPLIIGNSMQYSTIVCIKTQLQSVIKPPEAAENLLVLSRTEAHKLQIPPGTKPSA